MVVVAVGARAAIVGGDAALAVAGQHAEAGVVAQGGVGAHQEAAVAPLGPRGISVAVGAAAGAEHLAPDGALATGPGAAEGGVAHEAAVFDPGAPAGGEYLAGEAVEGGLGAGDVGQVGDGVVDAIALAQALRAGRRRTLVAGSGDAAEGHAVADHVDVDVGGVVGEAQGQEGLTQRGQRGAAEGPRAAAVGGDHGVAGPQAIEAGGGQNVDARRARYGDDAGGVGQVALAGGIELDLVGGAGGEGGVAGDVDRADGVAGGERAARSDGDGAGRAGPLQARAGLDEDGAAQGAVDLQCARADGHGGGVATVGAGEVERAGAQLGQGAGAG